MFFVFFLVKSIICCPSFQVHSKKVYLTKKTIFFPFLCVCLCFVKTKKTNCFIKNLKWNYNRNENKTNIILGAERKCNLTKILLSRFNLVPLNPDTLTRRCYCHVLTISFSFFTTLLLSRTNRFILFFFLLIEPSAVREYLTFN